jgi:hypothetical protein
MTIFFSVKESYFGSMFNENGFERLTLWLRMKNNREIGVTNCSDETLNFEKI